MPGWYLKVKEKHQTADGLKLLHIRNQRHMSGFAPHCYKLLTWACWTVFHAGSNQLHRLSLLYCTGRATASQVCLRPESGGCVWSHPFGAFKPAVVVFYFVLSPSVLLRSCLRKAFKNRRYAGQMSKQNGQTQLWIFVILTEQHHQHDQSQMSHNLCSPYTGDIGM